MKDLITSILGNYTQQVDALTGDTIYGLAGLDYEWIIGALFFAGVSLIVLKCISSLIVAAFKG